MVKLQIPQHMQGEDWARMPKPKERFFGMSRTTILELSQAGLSRRSRFVSQAQTKEYASFSFRAFESFSINVRRRQIHSGMNRVLPPENDKGWLGWHPSQTQRKEAERFLTDRSALGNPLVSLRFALPVSLGYNFEHEPGRR